MESVKRKSYDLPDAEFTDMLMSQMLADDSIADKADAYNTLQFLFGRKEGSGIQYNITIEGYKKE